MRIHEYRPRTWFLLLACAILLAGCLSIPLGDPDKSAIDNKLLGWWESKPADASADHELILMQAYDQHTYLVWYYSYSGQAGDIRTKGAMTFKGWLTQIGDARFLTLKEMTPTIELQSDPEKDRYTVLRMDQTGEGFTLRVVSDDFVKDCTTPDALLKKVTENVSNDALYGGRDKSPLYVKAGDARKDAIGEIVKKFHP
jgi:hypothetical protein